MLNQGTIIDSADVKTIEGVNLDGAVNTDDATLIANIQSAIRRGHRQFRPGPRRYERLAIVGGGPSLEQTLPELRDLVHDGAKIITLNGAYHWCLERNLHPSMQIVMDARIHNARFVSPFIPRCHFMLASQCAPETFDAVKDYPDQIDPVTGQHVGGVTIFHALGEVEGETRQILDAYYLKQWFAVLGGTTVAIRALNLLAMDGYSRFDLFGIDSCYMDHWRLLRDGKPYRYGGRESEHICEWPTREGAGQAAQELAIDYADEGWAPAPVSSGHAYEQPENEKDRRMPFKVSPAGRPDLERTFWCAPWHIKQAENLRELIAVNGDNFTITVHGDGLLAYMLASEAMSSEAPSCG